jgi:hypothetical protein
LHAKSSKVSNQTSHKFFWLILGPNITARSWKPQEEGGPVIISLEPWIQLQAELVAEFLKNSLVPFQPNEHHGLKVMQYEMEKAWGKAE